MNWITAPSRAFGVGETKSQNAVIKVYSAAELKAALTKLYQLRGGIGTIEIAGDIIITQAIELKQTIPPDSGPTEIIITAVSGAKILSGRAIGSSGSLDASNAVFRMGDTQSSIYNICKYTFRNLNINSNNAWYFRALLLWNNRGGVAGPVRLDNVTLSRTLYVFDKDSTGYAGADAVLQGSVVDGLTFDSNGEIPAASVLTLNAISCVNCSFSNITVRDNNSLGVGLSLFFRDQNNCINNSFNNIRIPFAVTSADGTHGTGIVNGAYTGYLTAPIIAGWQFNNVDLGAVSKGIRTSITAGDAIPSSAINTNGLDLVGVDQGSGIATIEHKRLFNGVGTGFGAATQILTPTLPANGYYIIDWKFNMFYLNQINSYHIITNARVSAGGVVTIVSNSTIFASEEFTTSFISTGLIPAVTGNSVFIEPRGAVTANINGSMTITGYKQV